MKKEMNKRFNELIEKKLLTNEEMQELESMEEVIEVEDCGMSGNEFIGCHWWNIKINDNNEYSVYTK